MRYINICIFLIISISWNSTYGENIYDEDSTINNTIESVTDISNKQSLKNGQRNQAKATGSKASKTYEQHKKNETEDNGSGALWEILFSTPLVKCV